MKVEDHKVSGAYRRTATGMPLWKYWLMNWKAWREPLWYLFLFVLLTGSIGLLIWRRTITIASSLATPIQNGSAVVVEKSDHAERNRQTLVSKAPYAVLLRMGQRAEWAMTEEKKKWERTEIGSTVPVTYRTGKNGDIFIVDWQPVSDHPIVDLQR